MKDVLATLEKAHEIQKRTAKRLAAMVLPNSHGFAFSTDGEPVQVDRIYESHKTQVLYLSIRPNTICDEHYHTSSNETFVVTQGSILYNNNEYTAGQTLVIPAKAPHEIIGGSEGGECVVILVPPEKAYSK